MSATPTGPGPTHEQHDLLPAFVAGTLDEAATDLFRAHLAACVVCRAELDLVQRVAAGTAAHGADFFADHPAVDDIVAVATGEDVGVADDAVRRHLAICAACAAEVSWVRGDASPARVAARSRWSARLGWVAAAAAVVALGVVLTLRPGSATLPSIGGATVMVDLERSTRAAPADNVGAVPAAAGSITLIFEVDLPPDAFPAPVEVIDVAGAIVLQATIASPAMLDQGLYFALTCGVDRCPPGRYTVRTAAGTPYDQRIPFELVPAAE